MKPWLLACGGVAVVALIVVLVIVFTSGPDTSSPQALAEAVVEAANAQDHEALVDLECAVDQERDETREVDPRKVDPSFEDFRVSFRPQSVEQLSEDRAKATFMVRYTGVPENYTAYFADGPRTLKLRKESGDWCVALSSGLAG